jgi:hypothetical protein
MSDDNLTEMILILRRLSWVSSWHRARLEEAEVEAASRGLKV